MLKSAFRKTHLKMMFVFSLFFSIGIPLFVTIIVQPEYQHLIVRNTESDAVLLASHLTSDEIRRKIPLRQSSFTESDHQKLGILMDDFNLSKIKIFSQDGEIVFSTDKKDVGQINQNNYFHDIVGQGNVYTKTVKKNQKSMENETMIIDVVECYVPIMVNNTFSGAFEIYFDITDRLNAIEDLYDKIVVWVLTFSVIFMAAVLLFLWYSGRYLEHRKKVEQEKEKLIGELTTALGKIKTLKGMIPICAHCKKIRDDQGYWNRIESYINVSSGGDLSHSICPECAKEHYADCNPYED